jgi:hypothetical protein
MAGLTSQQASFHWGPGSPVEPARNGRRTRVAKPGVTRPARASTQVGRVAAPGAWLTADEATAHLGLPSRKALYAAVARGQVPAHRLGRRRLRSNRGELDSLLGRLHESTGVR